MIRERNEKTSSKLGPRPFSRFKPEFFPSVILHLAQRSEAYKIRSCTKERTFVSPIDRDERVERCEWKRRIKDSLFFCVFPFPTRPILACTQSSELTARKRVNLSWDKHHLITELLSFWKREKEVSRAPFFAPVSWRTNISASNLTTHAVWYSQLPIFFIEKEVILLIFPWRG